MRLKLTWKQRNGIYRYVILAPGPFVKALADFLHSAPGITHVILRKIEKYEHVKHPDAL